MKYSNESLKRMTRRIPLAFLLILAGVSQATPLFAEDTATAPASGTPAASNPWREKRQEKMQALFEQHPEMKQKMDANGDGTVDKTEFQQARKAKKQEWQEKRQEKRQERSEAFFEKHPELKQKLDANGDGTVDRSEFQQGRQAKREEWKEKHQEKRQQFLENHPKLKERMDSNGDGKIERNEFKEARRERRYEHHRGDHDNNPPGMRGGPGTNWENRPGPQGGAGSSPDRGGEGRHWWGKKK